SGKLRSKDEGVCPRPTAPLPRARPKRTAARAASALQGGDEPGPDRARPLARSGRGRTNLRMPEDRLRTAELDDLVYAGRADVLARFEPSLRKPLTFLHADALDTG